MMTQTSQTAEKHRLVQTVPSFVEPDVPRRIKQISFGVMPPNEIVNTSEFHVYERGLYKMPERRPQPNGVLDTRLGISNKRALCDTCGQNLADCTGHFGYIALELPVFHIGYFRNTQQILQCICKSCARVLLNDDDRRAFARRFRNGTLERTRREAVFRRVLDRCKRVRICPHCGEINGPVKKAPSSLKLIHDQFNKNESALKAYQEMELADAAAVNDAIRQNLDKIADDLNPLRVQGLFRTIPDEDCELLDLAGRPENLLLTHVPVPPVCIRPSVEMDGGAGSNEDDLTVKLMQIVEVNNILRQGLERGLPVPTLTENWDFLQVQCAVYINSDLPGVTSMYQVPGKPTRGFVQRLKGKQGRFRGNLSGKRVDFSGRTVISPNPILGIEEVGVPRLMALTLTFPEQVTKTNIEDLRERVKRGAAMHPGANFVVFPNGDKTFLKYGDRNRISRDLKIGDIVERHLDNGDIVLFNRQPSLHRMSIMSHRVRVLEGRTLRFNECVCAPYNADFDGDEMNIHVPQTEEARAEAQELLGVCNNLSTPKSGEILIAATQDFLTASFLLTSKDTFLTRPQICALASYFLEPQANDMNAILELQPPAIIKPFELWTGKQAFELLIRPNTETQIFVNLETKEKVYGTGGPPGAKKRDDLYMDLSDGYVAMWNSVLLCGRLGKATLGGGNKSGLFQILASDYGPKAAAIVMNRLAKLSARLIGEFGFSIGVDDVCPSQNLNKEKQSAIQEGYKRCEQYISDWSSGKIELSPGCNASESLEQAMSGELNSIRERAAAACMAGLNKRNSPLIMSQCGSKGSPINIAQMVACVGQQSVSGKRAPNGFQNRSLPHFPRGDRSPEGKGFVANSFFSGLTPTEFFFHTMAGREGLVDTAVKTAETGYMSRRLMKALEDLYVHYDNSVRNAAGGIVQLKYGEDGLDPVEMDGKKGEPIAFDRLLNLARIGWCSEEDNVNSDELPLLPAELEVEAEEIIKSRFTVPGTDVNSKNINENFDDLDPTAIVACAEKFYYDLTGCMKDISRSLSSARQALGLPSKSRGKFELERLLYPIALTKDQAKTFIKFCAERYKMKRVDPGSTVGAFGAQSIGEPGTQMTLKTFHFAGVASMNVTLGVPRIKEIINAARNIATPVMRVCLDTSELPALAGSEKFGQENGESLGDMASWELLARKVKARLERTTLGEVALDIRQVVDPDVLDGLPRIEVSLDKKQLGKLHLHLSIDEVQNAILSCARLKLKAEQISKIAWKRRGEILSISLRDPISEGEKTESKRKPRCPPVNVQLQHLMINLPEVVVSGIPTVTRVVISQDTSGERGRLVLYVEGTGMSEVMGTSGVEGTTVHNNNVMEVASTLGIEAARSTIVEQIAYTMEQHGMTIDARHTMLLADCMTNKGEVLGITRFGIAKMKDSVLMLASFEKTTDHLFDAALHGRVDDVNGVSESIIMGIPMPTGTGLFKVMQQLSGKHSERVLPRRPDPILA